MITSLCQVCRIIRERYSDAMKHEEEYRKDLRDHRDDSYAYYLARVNAAEGRRKELEDIIEEIGRIVVMESECSGCRYSASGGACYKEDIQND